MIRKTRVFTPSVLGIVRLYLPKNHRFKAISTGFRRFQAKIMDTALKRPVSYGFETRTKLGNLAETHAGEPDGCCQNDSGALGTGVVGR